MLVPGGQIKSVPMHVAAVATGDGTAVVTTDINQGSMTTITFQVTGISGDTVTWEATIDGTNWVAVQVKNLNTGTEATTATTNGLYRLTCLGLMQVRANLTRSAGTVYVTGVASA